MSLLLLQRLSACRFPVTITSPADVDAIRILKAAALVDALFRGEAAAAPARATTATAQVLSITPRGWQELADVADRIVFGS